MVGVDFFIVDFWCFAANLLKIAEDVLGSLCCFGVISLVSMRDDPVFRSHAVARQNQG